MKTDKKNSPVIAVVGAGPAGSQSAYLLAKEGYQVHLFEKNKSEMIGRPVQCTGIVSKNFADFFTEEEMKKFTLSQVKGANIYSKNYCLDLRTDKVQAHIICRIKFDNFLLERAKNSGANIYPAHNFQSLRKLDNGKYELFFSKEGKKVAFLADKVIGADGPLSRVAKSSGMFGERKFWYGAQAVVKGNFDTDMVELHLGEDYPGFFAWLVPESQTLARIGVAADKEHRNLFDKIMEKKNLPKSSIKEMQGGLIPKFKKVKTEKDGIYLVGDAAMMTKQTTGGGIVMSLIAADCIKEHFLTGKSYESIWQKRLLKDLKMARTIRKFLDRLNDKKYDKLILTMNKSKNKAMLKEIGDMDFPSKFAIKLFLNDVNIITSFF